MLNQGAEFRIVEGMTNNTQEHSTAHNMVWSGRQSNPLGGLLWGAPHGGPQLAPATGSSRPRLFTHELYLRAKHLRVPG